MNIADLRQRYPGYSDDEIVGALQATKYQNFSVQEIKDVLGVKTPKRSLFAVANDTVIEAANAAAGTVGAIGDFISPGNAVSQFIDDKIIRAGEEKQSDAVKADKARFRDRLESSDGVLDELGAVGGYITDAPLQALAQAAGSFAVPAGGIKAVGGLAKAAGAGTAGVTRAGLAGGVGIGAAGAGGDAAGTAYDLSTKAGATDEQATSAARGASIIPAIIGGAGGLIGAERLVAGAGGFKGGLMSRALKTGAAEGLQEGIEEGATQYEGQRAAMPYDPTIDPSKGVAGAAGMGIALGFATGGGAALLHQQQKADVGMQDLRAATNADDAIDAALRATEVPLEVPPAYDRFGEALPPNAGPRAVNDRVIDEIRQLDPAQQQEALGLLATIGSARASPAVRRYAQNALDEMLLPIRQVPAGEATEFDAIPVGDVFEGLEPAPRSQFRTPAQIAEDGKLELDASRRAPVPAGDATEIQPDLVDLETIPTPDVIEVGGDAPRPEGMAERRRSPEPAPPAAPMTEEMLVKAVVDGFRGTNTPQARAFVQDFEAGRIKPADVLKLVGRPPASPDERLAAAAAQAPKSADGLLMTTDGQPYGTRAGAYVRAKKEDGQVVSVAGGWAVRAAPNQSDVQPAPLKGLPNSGTADADSFRDLTQSAAFKNQGLGGLDIPSQRMVLGRVLRGLQDDQVLDRVVQAIPVNVVNVLFGQKGPTKDALHNRAVLKDALSARMNDSVSADINAAADAIVRAVAGVAAEGGSSTPNATPVSLKDSAAVDAGKASVSGEKGAAARLRAEQSAGKGGGGLAGSANDLSGAPRTLESRQVNSPTRVDELGPPAAPTAGDPPTVPGKTPADDGQDVALDSKREAAAPPKPPAGELLGDGATNAKESAPEIPVSETGKGKPEPSTNTVFTEDAAAAARARLKAKLGRLQAGIDPETLMDGITLAGYHIEKGARTFAAYARAMVDDLGDAVKPYLKSWYLGVAFDPRAKAFNGEMSSAENVAALDVDAVLRKGVDAGLNQPAPDRVAMVSGLIADLPQRQALIEQGFDGLKVSDQRRVLAEMNARLQDDQVLKAVVESVPIDVVNVLMGRELSAKALFDKPAMLMNRFAVALNAPIPAGIGDVIDSLVSFLSNEGALSAAEVASKATDFGRATPRGNSAVKAGDRRHSEDGTSAQADLQTTDSAALEKLAQATEKARAAGLGQPQIDAITEQPLFDEEPERAAALLDEAVSALPEPAAPPTNDPFAGGYAALEGKMIEQTVTTDDGKTATLRMDAAVVMRDFDTRESALEELRLCLGRAA